MRNIPTTVELQNNIVSDLKTRLNLTDDDLKKNFDAISGVLAAQLKLLYLFLGDIQNNVFPDTADTFENGGTLERIGNIHLNRNRNPATIGVFVVSVNGVSGSVIRSGLSFKSNDTALNPGQTYITDTAVSLTGTNDLITIRSSGGGANFNLNIGDELTITEPVIGVEQIVTVSSITEEPRAEESINLYRQLILNAIQLEPQGGSRTDYRLWAADAQGVRIVYPYVADNNAGQVNVFVEANVSDSTDGFGTPSAQLLQDVADVIEFDPDISKPLNERGRRPIQATVSTLPIILNTVDININGLNTDTPEIRTAIENNIVSFLFNVRPFIAGADLLRNRNEILFLAELQAIIINTLENGNFFSQATMEVNDVSVIQEVFDNGNIPRLRNLTFN
jgi:uncharacterized phage protein gp47/JayE